MKKKNPLDIVTLFKSIQPSVSEITEEGFSISPNNDNDSLIENTKESSEQIRSSIKIDSQGATLIKENPLYPTISFNESIPIRPSTNLPILSQQLFENGINNNPNLLLEGEKANTENLSCNEDKK